MRSPAASWLRPLGHRPPHDAERSFYHLHGCDLQGRACEGTACFVARQSGGPPAPISNVNHPRLHCVGRCFAAPAVGLDSARPRIEVHAPEGVVLARLAKDVGPGLREYCANGGGVALPKALALQPAAIVDDVIESKLRGRGGAAYPTGKKWAAVSAEPAAGEKFIVANADEGDPGAYIDRFLMEGDPHALIEGMTIAAFAVGAHRGWIYLRAEYPLAKQSLERALSEARAAGLLGDDILGSGFGFELEIALGQGSYICGEETAMLRSLGGLRPEPTVRPPYPTQRGLFGCPTLVNNVETFATIPWILTHGGAAYARMGLRQSRGTKAFSLNSLFVRPGLYEVEFGTSIRQLVEEIGGGLRTGELKGLIIGGPLAGIVTPDQLDTPLDFEALHAIGAAVGHGGIIAFDYSLPMASLVHHVLSFGAYESCGKCTPCRIGTARLESIFARIADGKMASPEELDEVRSMMFALRRTSLCGHGAGIGEFLESALRHYGKELDTCWK